MCGRATFQYSVRAIAAGVTGDVMKWEQCDWCHHPFDSDAGSIISSNYKFCNENCQWEYWENEWSLAASESAFDEPERKPQSKHYRTVNGKTVRVCDECWSDMVVRTNRTTGEKFLGCSRYPECLHTEPLPEDQKMREMGA